MSIATILVPDFTLILIGFLLMRFTRWGEEFWSGLEKMVYFVLFPVLLFYSTARTPLDLHAPGRLLQVALAAPIAAIALGWLAKELAKNPLIAATAGGVIFNLLGLHIPEILGITMGRIGNASIALGLIMVGDGLRLSGLHEAKGMAAYFIAVKLIALPAIALLLGRWSGLPPLQLQIAVMFCALPTASSAYVLATRMGGNGPFVAFLISSGTLLSILSLPVWLMLAR